MRSRQRRTTAPRGGRQDAAEGAPPPRTPEDQPPFIGQQGREVFWLLLITFEASSLEQEEASHK